MEIITQREIEWIRVHQGDHTFVYIVDHLAMDAFENGFIRAINFDRESNTYSIHFENGSTIDIKDYPVMVMYKGDIKRNAAKKKDNNT